MAPRRLPSMTAASPRPPGSEPTFELLYRSLSNDVSCAFPCDEHGVVTIDELSDLARTQYLGARALVGRRYAIPVVRKGRCD